MNALDAVIVSPQKVFTASWVRLRCQYGCSEFLPGRDWKSVRELGPTLERTAFLAGYDKAFAFLCGPCDLCRTCVATQQKGGKAAACPHPDSARPAMEAAGIDVFATARAAGLPIGVVRSEHCPQDYDALVLVE